MSYVIIRDLRLVEQQQGALEIVQHVLFGTGMADILEEIHVRLVGAPELLVQGLDLADFAYVAVPQDGRGLGRTAVDGL